MAYLNNINFVFVLLFGIALSLSFADISIRSHWKDYVVVSCGFGILQGVVHMLFDTEILYKSYPLLTHFPLFLLLKYYYKKSSYIAGIAVLYAYLFCSPRKWFGTTVSFFWGYDAEISFITQILITIPLLFIIMKYASPSILQLKYEDNKVLRVIIFFPLIYYFMEYAITVYTDLLYTGGPAVVEFIDSSIVTVYFIFSIMFLKTLYEKKEVEVERLVLNIMVANFDNEIEALKKSEQQSRIYRHDLRHHLNYISSCIAENKLQDATDYISQICEGIDNMKVTQYSGNEALNLILSSYAGRAQEKAITVDIRVTTDNYEKFQIIDLCSLLANALENAINACVQIENPNERYITLHMYEKNNKLCLKITNSYVTLPVFEHDLPISKQSGHGIGVKSMIYVAEKYSGVYRFLAKDGKFTFQVSM